MDTADRFMIMGLCLQGILASPSTGAVAYKMGDDGLVLNEETMAPIIAANVRLAHLYADRLAPQAEAPALAAEAIKLARICYEAVRVSDLPDVEFWPPLSAMGDEHNSDLEAMFELVAERLAGRRVDATTPVERLVFTIVDVAFPLVAEEPDLFNRTEATDEETADRE